MSAIKLLLHIKEENLCREVVRTLKESSNPMSFDQHDSDWNALLERLSKTHPDVLLLDLSAVPGELNIAMRQLRYYSPGIKVIALHSSADPKTILAAMRAGVNEFLHPPFEDNLQAAIQRIASAAASDGAPAMRGKLIGFLSAKGGCGATTLACHVACELQNLTKKGVLLADLDLTSGLVGFLMKTPSSY